MILFEAPQVFRRPMQIVHKEYEHMQAVVFDLFGTLTDSYQSDEFLAMAYEMADCLQLPREAFALHWFRTTAIQRASGHFATITDNLHYICQMLQSSPSSKDLEAAATISYNYTRDSMKLRLDALAVISTLRAYGMKIGLVSDCPPDVPLIWSDHPLASLVDAPVFSCQVGMKKPQRAIYELAARRLNVPCQNCWYVGDGSSHELTGARQAGMHPILISVPYEDPVQLGLEESSTWDGQVITALSELIPLLIGERKKEYDIPV